jgi:hypothetical protein
MLTAMSIKDEPHYTISASELADWVEAKGAGSWWSVDGDPLLMGEVPFPCPAKQLATALRRITKPLLVLSGEPDADGRNILAADLDRVALRDSGEDRVLTLSWAGSDADGEWVLVEDRDAARIGSLVPRHATGG